MPAAIGRRIWAISLPVMFAELSETIIHVTDTAFLGRVGDTQLAALVLGDTILGLWLVLGLGLTDAMQIVVARRHGENDEPGAGKAFHHALVATLVLSIFLTVSLKLLSPWVSGLIAESAQVSAALNEFLQIAAYGLPFFCVSFAYSAFFIGIARTRVLVLATIVLGVVNLVLAYGLILGNLSMPALGLRGAAFASVGAEIATALFLVVYTVRRGYAWRYRMFEFHGWNPNLVWSLIGLAGPVVVYGVIESAQWLFFFIILEQLGTAVLAISNVIYACLLIFLIPAEALSETAVSFVSAAIGRGRREETRALLRRIALVAAAATLPMALLALVAPAAVFSIFFGIEETTQAGQLALRIVAGGLGFGVPWLVWMGGLQGTGDTLASSVIDSGVSVLILGWAATAAFVLDGGVAGVWSGLAIAWFAGLVASVLWMRSERWHRVTV